MKPKAFGSGNMAPKFGASKPPGKKPMVGRRRMNAGGPPPKPEPEPNEASKPPRRGGDFTRMPDYGDEAQREIDAGRVVIPSGRRATGGGIKRMANGEDVSLNDIYYNQLNNMLQKMPPKDRQYDDRPTLDAPVSFNEIANAELGILRSRLDGNTAGTTMEAPASRSVRVDAAAGTQRSSYPANEGLVRVDAAAGSPMGSRPANEGVISIGNPAGAASTAGAAAPPPPTRAATPTARAATPTARPRPAARPRGPTAGEREADRLMDLYNRPGGVSQEQIRQTRDEIMAARAAGKMKRGGKVKKMAIGSQVTAPPKPSPEDPQNTFVPTARAKLARDNKRRSQLGIPEDLNIKKGGKVSKPWEGSKADMAQDRKLAEKQNMSMAYGGKVKKMAYGGSASEMQAFMKGRRDARSSMAPKAPMAPKASMASKAPMPPKARMASKAPMAPKASMPFMKSGGAVKSKSRGNGCAVKGHTRGRMV